MSDTAPAALLAAVLAVVAAPSAALPVEPAAMATPGIVAAGGMEHAPAATMVGDIAVSGAWMRQPPPGAKVGGGYVTLKNTGEDDRLVGAQVAFAGHVEIHEMSMAGGVMEMRPLDEGLVLPAGETVMLRPGGYHLMFMGLTDAPRPGDTVPVTLTFEKAGTETIMFEVAKMGAAKMPMHHGAKAPAKD